MLTSYGKHSCFFGQCNQTLITGQHHPNHSHYNRVVNLLWSEPRNSIRSNVPATKPAISLVNEIQIEPVPGLFHYKINIPIKNKNLARKYIESLPKNNGIIMVHYEGNSSAPRKNIHPDVIRFLAQHFIKFGYLLIILDWDYRSPLPKENNSIFCPNMHNAIWEGKGTGNAATIAALIEHAKLFIGIDSGPLHIAGATKVPSIGIWTNHHPAHFFDLADHVIHLIPNDARRYLRGNKDQTLHFFEKHYRYAYYGGNSLAARLLETACELLTSDPPPPPPSQPIVFENYFSNVSHLIKGQWWMIGPTPGAIVF